MNHAIKRTNYLKKENARIEDVNAQLYQKIEDLERWATSCGSTKCAKEKLECEKKCRMAERASIHQDTLLTEAYESKCAKERQLEALQRKFDQLTLQQNGKLNRNKGILTRSERTESTTD